MAGPTVGIRFQGDDFVSPTVKNIHNEITGLATSAKSSILTGFGLGVGVAAFGLVKNAVTSLLGPLGDAWQLSKDTQVAQVLLAQALKNNVPAWNGSTYGAEQFALAQGKLGFQSNEVRDALSHLVGVTHDVGQAERDVALAEDLARSKGISLTDATNIVTKAHEGNAKALKSLGIDIKGATTATELLDAVQKNVTTTARVWAETSEGKAAQAQVKLTEAMTKLGNVIDSIAQTVIPIAANALGFLIDNFNTFLPAIVAVSGAITVAMIPALIHATVAAWALAAPFLPLIAGLAALAAAAMFFTVTLDDNAQAAAQNHAAMSKWGTNVTQTLQTVGQGYSDLPVIAERGLEASRKAMVDGANTTLVTPIVDAAYNAAEAAAAKAAQIPQKMGDAMVANDQALIGSALALRKVIVDSLTPAEQEMSAIAFLGSAEYAAALVSGKPAAIAKANELANAAYGALNGFTASGAAAGTALGNAWADGLINGLKNKNPLFLYWLNKYKNLLGGSLPEEGPLKGDTAERGGKAIAEGWMKGIGSLAGGTLNLPTFPTGGGMATAPAYGPSAGGGTVNIYINDAGYVDGPALDRFARTIAQRLNLVGVT